MKKKFKFLIFFITSLYIFSSFAASAELLANEINDGFEESGLTEPHDYSPMFSLPNNLRGVIISPEIDFFTSPEDSHESILLQLDTLFNNIKDLGLNSVIIQTATPNRTYYNLDMNASRDDSSDYIDIAVQKAKSLFLNVYLVYDIMPVLEAALNKPDAINNLISEAHRFVIKYPCDGIILDSYYSKSSQSAFAKYMQNGSGIGFDNWLFDSTEYYFETVSNVIRVTNNSVPVGIMINDVWANESSNALGSPTQDSVEALFDGYADTKKYLENKYADFALIRAYGAIDDVKLPFTETMKWWSEICSANDIYMYIIHYNEKIGTDYPGWSSEAQLLQQLTVSKDIMNYSGSIFNSPQSLFANPLNSTSKLQQFYSDQINEESLFNELKMFSPDKLSFTTYEPVVDFSGTFDENYDVYFNGNKIKLNEAGKFYFEEQLDVGMNNFKIKHKDKTYNYQIERKIITMKELVPSIAAGKTLRVEGETSINIEAVAYKDASVVATINGQTIKLKQRSTVLQDEDLNTSYASYTGKYTVPAGIIEKEQPLGKIVVQATYMGYSNTIEGASVVINALPKPPEVIVEIKSNMLDQDSLGSGEVVGTISAVKPENEEAKLVKVNNNFTHVLDAKDTGTVYTPNFNQLPAGTVDYFKSDVGGFYTTESGKRFFTKDTSVVDGYGIGENNLLIKSSGTYGGDSYFKIKLDKRISYQIEAVDVNYFTEWGADYNVSGFNSSYIYITFDNITSVTKLPSFEANMVFDSGSWEQVTVNGIPKFRLVLKLRQKGVYMGNKSYYNSDGDLILSFPVMQNTLSSMTVVIDPGHGYGKENPNTYDPGAIGQVIEQEVNLQVAKILSQKLKEQGVNSVRLETEKSHFLTVLRPVVARDYGCDLFISLHSNKVQGKDDVRGTEVYYFTPFSQPLASLISASISNYFTKNVYADGADKNRGAKYLDFWVLLQQDFPAVLIEMGFVNNMEDAMALANSKHQEGIANAIIAGIKSYISRSNISYSADGNVIIPDSESPFTPEAEQTTTASFEEEIIDVPAEETTNSIEEKITNAVEDEPTDIDDSILEDVEIFDDDYLDEIEDAE